MKFILEHDSWVCLRPSGTEPKIKCYYGVCEDKLKESEAVLAKLKETMEGYMEQIISSH